LAKRNRVRLADLQDEKIIAPSPARWPRAHNEIVSAFARAGVSPQFVWDIASDGVAINLIREGMAIGFVSSSIDQSRQLDGCALLSVEDLDVPLHLAAVWRRARETPAV